MSEEWRAYGRRVQWFDAARWAVRELYRQGGWSRLVEVPRRGPRVLSGCEQTVLVAVLLSGRDRASVDGASAGVAAALEEIRREEWEAIVMPGKGFTKAHPHGKSIKHNRIYAALRARGMSKSRAAAISNATTPKHAHKGKR